MRKQKTLGKIKAMILLKDKCLTVGTSAPDDKDWKHIKTLYMLLFHNLINLCATPSKMDAL